MSVVKRRSQLALAGIFVLLLAACASRPDIFDGSQTDEDKLPAGVTQSVEESIVASSTRFAWADGELEYFAAKSAEDPDGVCLLTLDGLELQSACGTGNQLPLVVETPSGELALGTEPPTASGWVSVSDVLWKRE